MRGTVTLDGEWVDLRYAFAGEARVGEARLDGLAISGVMDPRAIAIDDGRAAEFLAGLKAHFED